MTIESGRDLREVTTTRNRAAYEGGRFTVKSPELFRLLSAAALAQIPMRD